MAFILTHILFLAKQFFVDAVNYFFFFVSRRNKIALIIMPSESGNPTIIAACHKSRALVSGMVMSFKLMPKKPIINDGKPNSKATETLRILIFRYEIRRIGFDLAFGVFA